MKTRLSMVCSAVLIALVLVGVSIAAAKSFDLPEFQKSVDHPQPLPQVKSTAIKSSGVDPGSVC